MKTKAEAPILSNECPAKICLALATLDRFPWTILGKLENDSHGGVEWWEGRRKERTQGGPTLNSATCKIRAILSFVLKVPISKKVWSVPGVHQNGNWASGYL